MRFELEITGMGNAAFVENDEGGPEVEVSRILRVAAARVEEGMMDAGILHDINGNTVGRYRTLD
jgi:hypothetical protein